MAMSAALAAASPYLLEPVAHVTIHSPGSATSRITSALSSHRARMLGMTPREGWSRWEAIEALIPEAELRAFGTELRSMSQGMASFEARHDHLAEVNEKLAQTIVQQVHEPA
jgi:elongation factor G